MRILTIVKKLTIGGTERVAQNYSIGYKQSGNEVAILTTHGGGIREDILRKNGIDLFIGSMVDHERATAVQQAIEWKPEIIHIHRPGLADSLTGSILRKFKQQSHGQIRIIETNVFAWPDYSPDRKLIDVHLLLSRWCYWKWSSWMRGSHPAPRGIIIPNAVNTKNFFPLSDREIHMYRKTLSLPPHAIVFGRIGQPNFPNWSRVAFDSFSTVAQQYRDIYLLLVGLPDIYKSYIGKFPDSVRSRIVISPVLNSDEELRRCYNSIDIFIHSSTMGESFGLVLAEAMLCEIPVITLSTPERENSQLEIVGHRIGGLVVADKKNFIKAMEKLISDTELRKQLGRQGRERIIRNYDSAIIVPQLLKLMKILKDYRDTETLDTALSDYFGGDIPVDGTFIKENLSYIMGRTPIGKRVMMNMVHNPILYRAYASLRNKLST